MRWEFGFDSKWNRDIGYGVPACCDQPDCVNEINRGLSYVCGGGPYSEDGCGLYFCDEHLKIYSGLPRLCERCSVGNQNPFEPSRDHPDWVNYKLNHHSWSDWRNKNPDKVNEMKILSNSLIKKDFSVSALKLLITKLKLFFVVIFGYRFIAKSYRLLKKTNFSFGKHETIRQKLFYYFYHSKNFRSIKTILPLFVDGSNFKNTNEITLFLQLFDKGQYERETETLVYKNKLEKIKKNALRETLELEKNGYTKISEIIKLDSSTISDFVNIAKKSDGYDAQVALQSSLKLKKINNEYNCFSLKMSLDTCERFFKPILDNDYLKRIINDYLRFKGELYSVNSLVTMPSKQIHNSTNIHRDGDDRHALTLFIYWTEVSSEDGATFFIPGSHNKFESANNGIYFEGQPGQACLVDNFGFHSGNRKIKKPRVVTWFRFGKRVSSEPYISNKDYLFSDMYDKIYTP